MMSVYESGLDYFDVELTRDGRGVLVSVGCPNVWWTVDHVLSPGEARHLASELIATADLAATADG